MSGTFSGINIAQSSLLAQRTALDVIGHNIANSANSNYSRQIPLLTSTSSLGLPTVSGTGIGGLGTGTSLKAVYRLRSEFVENQIRSQYMDLSSWQVLGSVMERVSAVFNDSVLLISKAVDDLGDAFGTLGRTINADTITVDLIAGTNLATVNNVSLWNVGDKIDIGGETFTIDAVGPAGVLTLDINASITHLAGTYFSLAVSEDTARAQVKQQGDQLTTLLRQGWRQLESMALEANEQIKVYVGKANSLLEEIARLNGGISQAQVRGMNANDAMDSRDAAIRELSQIMNFDTRYNRNGSVNLILGGHSLVTGTKHTVLSAVSTNRDDGRFARITMKSAFGNREIDIDTFIRSGALGGFKKVRDENIQYYSNKLNEVARSLINQVNAIHAAGYAKDRTTTNVDFFIGLDARDINVNYLITSDNNFSLIAASNNSAASVNVENGKNARHLEDISSLLMNKMKVSRSRIYDIFLGIPVDPFSTLGSQIPQFLNAPVGPGTTNIDGIPVDWFMTDTIEDIINRVNDSVPGVKMVFNEITQQFFILSPSYIDITDTVGNLLNWTDLRTRVVSATMVTQRRDVTYLRIDPNQPLNDPNNRLALDITPSTTGQISINGVIVSWDDSMSMNNIAFLINISGSGVSATYDTNRGELRLVSQGDIDIADVSGNFTVFTNLYNVGRLQDFSASISAESAYDSSVSRDQVAFLENQIGLLNAQQNAISGVNTDVELASILKYEKAYNATVQVLSVLDSMLNTLINRMGGGGGTVNFGSNN